MTVMLEMSDIQLPSFDLLTRQRVTGCLLNQHEQELEVAPTKNIYDLGFILGILKNLWS